MRYESIPMELKGGWTLVEIDGAYWLRRDMGQLGEEPIYEVRYRRKDGLCAYGRGPTPYQATVAAIEAAVRYGAE